MLSFASSGCWTWGPNSWPSLRWPSHSPASLDLSQILMNPSEPVQSLSRHFAPDPNRRWMTTMSWPLILPLPVPANDHPFDAASSEALRACLVSAAPSMSSPASAHLASPAPWRKKNLKQSSEANSKMQNDDVRGMFC